VGSDKPGGGGSGGSSGGSGGDSPCPRLVQRLLARKDELLSLRASRRAHSAALEGVLRPVCKKHALTKLERQELRDVRARLKALLGEAAAAVAGGAEAPAAAPGSVTIGIATLSHLWRDVPGASGSEPDGVSVGRDGSGKGASISEESFAKAVAALSPAELLVHECLSAAGIDLDGVRLAAAWSV
jgi:hypothetical protein